jgi:hypothetical protein
MLIMLHRTKQLIHWNVHTFLNNRIIHLHIHNQEPIFYILLSLKILQGIIYVHSKMRNEA